jgi:hypothetical protein
VPLDQGATARVLQSLMGLLFAVPTVDELQSMDAQGEAEAAQFVAIGPMR